MFPYDIQTEQRTVSHLIFRSNTFVCSKPYVIYMKRFNQPSYSATLIETNLEIAWSELLNTYNNTYPGGV